ncbi:ATP-binding protein [Candidatus Bipolaricaulota bacterium]
MDVGRLNRIVKLAEEADLLSDPKIEQWIRLLSIDWDNDAAEMVEQYLAQAAERYTLDPLSRRDISDLATLTPDGLLLGFDSSGLPVFLKSSLLTRNMLITGETGSGKTNLMKVLIRDALDHGLTVWVFDFKNEYRDVGLPVIHWRDLRLNPLSFLDERDFLLNGKLLQRVFGHSQGLWLASQALLGDVLFDLYHAYGVDTDPERTWPSLHDLRAAIEERSVRHGTPSVQYKDRLLNRLTDMLKFEGVVFDCSGGFPMGDLVNHSLVFEFRGMKPQTISLVCELLLAGLYEYWVARGPQAGLTNLLFSDEAKHVFDIRKTYRMKDERPYVDEILAETRSFGIGLVLADQQPSELTPSVQANTHVKLEMQLGSGKDIRDMNIALGLNPRQIKASYGITLGEGILKISGKDPFRLRVPRFIPRREIP